jgi:hypothetical protein
MSPKPNDYQVPFFLMDEYQTPPVTPEYRRVLNLARGEHQEQPETNMRDMIEHRFAEGKGILPIDTRDSDALLAQKVRRALAMANGQRIALIQWNDPKEQNAAEPETMTPAQKQLQDLRIFRDLLQGAAVDDLAFTYNRDELERGQIIETGLQLINEVQQLHLDMVAMEGSLQTPWGENMWLIRVEDAIQTLKLQPDMGAHA